MARTEVSSGVSPLYGMKRTSSSASRVLTDRALEFDPRHLREQIDIGARSRIRRAHVTMLGANLRPFEGHMRSSCNRRRPRERPNGVRERNHSPGRALLLNLDWTRAAKGVD